MRRIIVVVLASLALVIAAYMALDQWRIIPGVWDPLGGGQTQRVLDSSVSRMIRKIARIPDSALGALAYLGEIVLAIAARRRRLLIVYGLWSAGLALAGIALVAMQIFVVHAICFLCCCTATLSVVIFTIAWTEI